MPGRELVAVYADESCLGNGREGENPGGAGVLVEYRRAPGTSGMPGTPAAPEAPLVRRDLWLSERATTNNRMALRSVIAAFHELGAKGGTFDVVFTSDSRYIVDGMTQWVHGWSRRGWSRKGGAIENLELWFEALEAAAPHAVRWDWVRGHAGHAQNEYANHLATTAAAQQSSSGGLVASGFDAWFTAERARGARHADPADFPDRASFRAHSALPAPPF